MKVWEMVEGQVVEVIVVVKVGKEEVLGILTLFC